MIKPSAKSSIDRAAAGEGSLNNALRARDTSGLQAADQSVIADILNGGRSTLDSVAHGKPARRPVPTPPLRPETGEPAAREDRKVGVPVTSVAALGELVRQARVRLSLNQQRFADLAGVGRRFVSELEAGKATVETERVLRCCLAAGIDIIARPRQP